MVAVKNSEKGV